MPGRSIHHFEKHITNATIGEFDGKGAWNRKRPQRKWSIFYFVEYAVCIRPNSVTPGNRQALKLPNNYSTAEETG